MTDSQKWMTLVLIAAVGGLFYLLAPILMPFLAAFLLAYLGSPLVDRLCGWKIPRVLSVAIVFFVITLFFLGVIGILIPGIKNQIIYLNTKTPDFVRWLNTQALPWIQETFQIDLKHLDMSEINELIGSSWQQAGSMAGQVISKIAASGMNIVGFLASLALIPVLTFYLLLDWPKLVSHIQTLLPRQIEGTVMGLVKECDDVLSAFLRGQFLVMICLSIVYSLGLKVVGLDIAFVVGLIAGLGSIIPYFGFTIGIVIATIAAIFQFQEWLPVVWVWTVFGIGQVVEGWVLVPYLVGNKVGLHPVAVIFAILAGGQLFGFFGMLLAIPVAAVIVVLMRHVSRRYFASDLYK
ncbi:AI-2E family transporter [Bdellovibrio sp. HCB337]|uniref:AI-2E family transporter n=1 Tax=Bdellovibrio sp. HCB337 TaxID=3394358 RepID=UPI0039A65162